MLGLHGARSRGEEEGADSNVLPFSYILFCSPLASPSCQHRVSAWTHLPFCWLLLARCLHMTMMGYLSSLSGLALLLRLAASQTVHNVNVGQSGLSFSPNSISAAVGDIVQFTFFPGGHSATQGAFDTPCNPGSVSNGFFSGFVDPSSGNVFQVTINSTDPIWFYCSQVGHCEAGMVGAINPP
jgi:plastocyanin